MLVDTLEYSSHTTGSDALWGGVPLLTLPGEAMAARVGWSLIRAAGVPDGRVQGLREYMDRAAEFGSSSIDYTEAQTGKLQCTRRYTVLSTRTQSTTEVVAYVYRVQYTV